MANILLWLGIVSVALVLVYDFERNYLSPRISTYEWYPREPDLPPVAGEKEGTETNSIKVLLVGYVTGISVLLIGLIDYSPVKPTCIPSLKYVSSVLALTSGFMWYAETENVTIQYHGTIRYCLGGIGILAGLYLGICGEGII